MSSGSGPGACRSACWRTRVTTRSSSACGRGDKLLLYSDGLTECPLAVGGFLEEDGLIALCRKHGMARGEEMISRMAGDLVRMSGAVDFPDDASALLVEYDGSGR
jgi:serine phosphatase RsbU (regulator of sigma subunit)